MKSSREWEKFENDEIMTIWKGFLVGEFGREGADPLKQAMYSNKPIRLTPLEIMALVDDLMRRLEIKDNDE